MGKFKDHASKSRQYNNTSGSLLTRKSFPGFVVPPYGEPLIQRLNRVVLTHFNYYPCILPFARLWQPKLDRDTITTSARLDPYAKHMPKVVTSSTSIAGRPALRRNQVGPIISEQ